MQKPFEINDESSIVCLCCGTCCRNGGPALHRQDRSVVIAGHIGIEHLYTIRTGERVCDNVAGGLLTVAEGEIIKIREARGTRACMFFNPGSNQCAIYLWRPCECRVLSCRDTGAIRHLYRRDRLGRQDLIGHIDGLCDLVVEHDRRCSAGRLFALADRWRTVVGRKRIEAELARMVAYDEALRCLLVEQGRVSAPALDFLLGRPPELLLRRLGIVMNRQPSAEPLRP